MIQLRRYILLFFLLLPPGFVGAQTSWPSPEIEQMYYQARDQLSRGNLPDAINTYKQAILLAPDQMVLYRDLAKAYYLSGNYAEAQHTLDPVLKSSEADDQSYEIMASCQGAAGEKKKARSTIQSGLAKFPNSGVLYHALGKLYEEDGKMPDALRTWIMGIQKDHDYHVNYYEAARTYMNTSKPVWAIIYAEYFINMERHTNRSDDTRAMLLHAYALVFNSIGSSELPQFGRAKKADNLSTSFEEAVRSTLLKLSPVISDGINTETLTMLRTRFLMEWFSKYGSQYPLSLFTYQDNMLRNGYFEIYNEWLFGKADNIQDYEAWNKFHEGDIAKFEAWAQQYKLHPEAGDFYNDMSVDNIFNKPKK